MKLVSNFYDSRIKATNVLIEMSISEYHSIVKGILDKNQFQRKRVRNAKSVYSLLKEDLLIGCVIPPIVLAMSENIDIDLLGSQISQSTSLIILDGLQRTYTIFDIVNELGETSDSAEIDTFLKKELRVEIYIGLNKLGILYRMLTLNTGQTPMSLRQQIEMLYSDYINIPVDGIKLIRESDDDTPTLPNEYRFKDIVEGFNSYLDRDELPIDKSDILENITTLIRLAKENQEVDLFKTFLTKLHLFITQMDQLCGTIQLAASYLEKNGGTPFGRNILQFFKKSQVYTGFGAAIGILMDYNLVSDFNKLDNYIKTLSLDNPLEFLEEMNDSMYWLKNNTKKIGNAQRTFFTYFFRDLFNKDADSFLSLRSANDTALRKYRSQYL